MGSFVFQSPSLRGSGRFLPALEPERAKRLEVSIPFIAGQWSLRVQLQKKLDKINQFQSPSLRGSGRFRLHVGKALWYALFQSPSLRGSGRFASKSPGCDDLLLTFQSPSLRGSGRFRR